MEGVDPYLDAEARREHDRRTADAEGTASQRLQKEATGVRRPRQVDAQARAQAEFDGAQADAV